jgi:hypothetical protein
MENTVKFKDEGSEENSEERREKLGRKNGPYG